MKILIIGAGPIGCYAARILREESKRFDIEIIEEHDKIGRPLHCAGLVSKDVLLKSRVPLKETMVINRIDGAEFFLNGDSFRINRPDVALVIDREKFDRALGEGLKVNLNTKFVGIENEGSRYLVETDRGEYCVDIVIGADGANSAVRRTVGFHEHIEYLHGAQFRIRYHKPNKNIVDVYLKSPSFAWVIPENEEIVRVGIISDNPYHDLIRFLKERSINGEILEKFAGIVPLGNCSTQRKNIVLVGDAACQVKPLTHGGIYYGMRCAEILVDCILENRISRYERRWRQRFDKEIQIGLRVKKLYQHLGEDNIEKIFLLLKKNIDLLERFGDFENHSKVISAIIKNPSLQGLLGNVLIGIIKDIPL